MEFRSKITVELVGSAGGDAMVCAAARVSTRGQSAHSAPEPEQAGLINYLISHRHGTPFEHAMLTFFVHAPIFVWREWHRHRVGFSYNEQSARYMQLEPVFWIPEPERPLIPVEGFKSARPKFGPASPAQHEVFVNHLKASYTQSYSTYQNLIDNGYAKEAARAVLPVGIFSSCWVTCNPRSLMHFLSLRTHDAAAKFISYPQHEIEVAARQCEQMFAQGWPITHAAWQKNGRVAP